MITASMLVDVYIDINILLLFACFLGLISTLLLRVMGLGHAVSVRLGLLRWGFLAVLTIPVAVSLLSNLQGAIVGFNLSDFIVAQYLQGRFQIDPFTLDSMLSLRDQTTTAIMKPEGWVTLVLGALVDRKSVV